MLTRTIQLKQMQKKRRSVNLQTQDQKEQQYDGVQYRERTKTQPYFQGRIEKLKKSQNLLFPQIHSKKTSIQGSRQTRRRNYSFQNSMQKTDLDYHQQTLQCLNQCQRIISNLKKLTKSSYKKGSYINKRSCYDIKSLDNIEDKFTLDLSRKSSVQQVYQNAPNRNKIRTLSRRKNYKINESNKQKQYIQGFSEANDESEVQNERKLKFGKIKKNSSSRQSNNEFDQSQRGRSIDLNQPSLQSRVINKQKITKSNDKLKKFSKIEKTKSNRSTFKSIAKSFQISIPGNKILLEQKRQKKQENSNQDFQNQKNPQRNAFVQAQHEQQEFKRLINSRKSNRKKKQTKQFSIQTENLVTQQKNFNNIKEQQIVQNKDNNKEEANLLQKDFLEVKERQTPISKSFQSNHIKNHGLQQPYYKPKSEQKILQQAKARQKNLVAYLNKAKNRGNILNQKIHNYRVKYGKAEQNQKNLQNSKLNNNSFHDKQQNQQKLDQTNQQNQKIEKNEKQKGQNQQKKQNQLSKNQFEQKIQDEKHIENVDQNSGNKNMQQNVQNPQKDKQDNNKLQNKVEIQLQDHQISIQKNKPSQN